MITASFDFRGAQHNNVPVLNPGGWFGKTWLLEIGVGYSSLFLVAEADSAQDAIDVLADDEKYGYHIRIPEEDVGDDCYLGGNCELPCNLDGLFIHDDVQVKYRVPGRDVDPGNFVGDGTAITAIVGTTLVPVLNPGDGGQTWLLEAGTDFLVVEAKSAEAAIDVLADDEKYGYHIRIPESDYGDYDLEDCYYGGSAGYPCDLTHLRFGEISVKYRVPDRDLDPEDFAC